MKFYLPDRGESVADALKVPDFIGNDIYDFVQAAADYYHDKCDGYNAEWPITFAIVDDQLCEIGRYEVDREMVANFSWRRK